MKVGAGIGQSHRLAVLVLTIRKNQYVGIVRMVELIDHVRFRWTQATCECRKLGRRQRLRAKHEHLGAKKCLLDVGEFLVGERPRKIDAPGFQTEARAKRFGLQHSSIHFVA